MLDYKNNKYDAIIVGDSRIVRYDLSDLSESTGYNYINMAYGGCITNEMASLVEWCFEKQSTELKEIVIVTSFYNMNVLLQQDRVASTEKVIKSPFSYAFNMETAEMMINSLKKEDSPVTETKKELTEEEKAENFKSHENSMSYYLDEYVCDYGVIERLNEICKKCTEAGIEVKIILPPWWQGYYELLQQRGLLEILDEYKAILSENATVYDFEYAECPLSDRYDEFIDYTHFSGETSKLVFKAFTEEDIPDCRIWKNGSFENNQE